jgi:hypothetical protein
MHAAHDAITGCRVKFIVFFYIVDIVFSCCFLRIRGPLPVLRPKRQATRIAGAARPSPKRQATRIAGAGHTARLPPDRATRTAKGDRLPLIWASAASPLCSGRWRRAEPCFDITVSPAAATNTARAAGGLIPQTAAVTARCDLKSEPLSPVRSARSAGVPTQRSRPTGKGRLCPQR